MAVASVIGLCVAKDLHSKVKNGSLRAMSKQTGVKMLSEFKAFIARGNVLDLAVAVIIGGAFGKIVTSQTDDVIMPVVALVFGGLNFSSKFFLLAIGRAHV